MFLQLLLLSQLGQFTAVLGSEGEKKSLETTTGSRGSGSKGRRWALFTTVSNQVAVELLRSFLLNSQMPAVCLIPSLAYKERPRYRLPG